MSELLTLASERPVADNVDILWGIASHFRGGLDYSVTLRQLVFSEPDSLETKVCVAVRQHLVATCGLSERSCSETEREVSETLSAWDQVLDEIERESATLTPRSHVFHLKLARKYADYYRSFERKALVDWVLGSRFKTEAISAFAQFASGDPGAASKEINEIALRWRNGVPIRLPGLKVIEQLGYQWAKLASDTQLASSFEARQQELSGVYAPYQEDDETVWTKPRRAQQIVRFGFAATRLPIAS